MYFQTWEFFGAPGVSLRGGRELFPRASVVGADIDRRILFKEDRIKTLYCDQLNPSSIRELWGYPDLRGGADIIIEDGLHTFEANISFLEESLDHLRPGGIYVTEDILSDYLEDWYKRLETIYSKRYPNYEFASSFCRGLDPITYQSLVGRTAEIDIASSLRS
jgi:hypothetical protein